MMCIHNTLVHMFKLTASLLLSTMLHRSCSSSQVMAPTTVFYPTLHYCTRVFANNPILLQFALLHIEYKKDLSTGTAADPSAG